MFWGQYDANVVGDTAWNYVVGNIMPKFMEIICEARTVTHHFEKYHLIVLNSQQMKKNLVIDSLYLFFTH